MKKTIIKSIILFLSIPIINSIAFGIGAIFHEMYQSTISVEQFQSYQIATISMILILIISIPMLEFLNDNSKLSKRTTNQIYLGVFAVIAVLTFDQFSFRPFEHGLTYLSIVSLILTREILNKTLMPTKPIRNAG